MKQRAKLASALAFLACAALIALPRGSFDGSNERMDESAETTAALEASILEQAVEATPAPVDPSGPLVADLLAAHGSHPSGVPVRDAFRRPFATRSAETLNDDSASAETVPLPQREPLPRHRVSLVLLDGSEPRAVVDERVVRIGDELEAGVVTDVLAEGVLVHDGEEERLYALGSDGPPAPDPAASAAPAAQEDRP